MHRLFFVVEGVGEEERDVKKKIEVRVRRGNGDEKAEVEEVAGQDKEEARG